MEYSAKEIEKIEKQLDKHYGENLGVFHEIVTEGKLHIDCQLYSTRIGCEEFYTVATIGMSKYTMEDAPNGYRNIELMICMPKTWDYNKEVWPFNLLKLLAKMPCEMNTILGPYHTVDLQNNFCKNEGLKAIFIEFPRNYFPEETVFKLKKTTIRYLQVYPIYYDEMEAIRNENEEVMEKVVEHSIFNEFRKSVI